MLADRVVRGETLTPDETRLLALCHIFAIQRLAAILQIAEGEIGHQADGEPKRTVRWERIDPEPETP